MTVIRAFTLEQAARLAKVSERQVAYWAGRSVLKPSIMYDRARRPTRYLYSFQDVVGLRVIGILRKQHELSLQKLTKAGKRLQAHAEQPWSELTFWIRGKDLFFYDPERDNLVSTDGRTQLTSKIEIEPIAREMREEANAFARRNPSDIGKIERRRNVQRNQPVVKGTRVPVSSILNLAADGYDTDAIVHAYPSLTLEDVHAVLAADAQVHVA